MAYGAEVPALVEVPNPEYATIAYSAAAPDPGSETQFASWSASTIRTWPTARLTGSVLVVVQLERSGGPGLFPGSLLVQPATASSRHAQAACAER
jgi:hypothetical protein